MARPIHNHLNKMDVLELNVDITINQVLKAVDIAALLADPRRYMQELGKQYFESMEDELNYALKQGNKLAKEVMARAT